MAGKVISLFSGAGGLDYGFEAAGFETVVASDLDPTACRFLKANRDWPIVEGAIAELSTAKLLAEAKLEPKEADVLIGGPPCQPFSKSGYWASGDAKRMEDPRAKTLGEYLRVLKEAQPRAFLLENVPGLAYKGKSEGIEKLREGIASLNEEVGTRYSVEFASLNAADYGVPQRRERVFVIGFRDGMRFEFPKPTHGGAGLLDGVEGLKPYATAWDAIGDLARSNDTEALRLRGKWADLLPSIPEGSNYLHHTERGEGVALFGWRRRYWSFLLKLSRTLPSWTIQAQPGPAIGPFHWDNRRLSAREMARLQTFPDDLDFDGFSIAECQRLLGNAVASGLAQILAGQIAKQLRLDVAADVSLLPEATTDTTAPTSPAPVPERYLDLVGKDTEHPGTGQGRGALARDEEVVVA